MRKILITGATGYVGAYLKARYEKTYHIVTFSRLSSTLDECDLTDVDIIIHCAALVHQSSQRTRKEYTDINCDYPVSLAKKAVREGVQHFIFLSTVSVFGSEVTSIDSETIASPDTLYGQSKFSAERQLLDLSAKEEIVMTILRPPMIYGRDAPGNMKKLNLLVARLPFIPLGGINNKRSFLSINNLGKYVDKVLELQVGGVFLVSDMRALSTSGVIECLSSVMQKRGRVFSLPFFGMLVAAIFPEIYRRLFTDFVINAEQTCQILGVQDLEDPEIEIKRSYNPH